MSHINPRFSKSCNASSTAQSNFVLPLFAQKPLADVANLKERWAECQNARAGVGVNDVLAFWGGTKKALINGRAG